jgi:hypothetical protein
VPSQSSVLRSLYTSIDSYVDSPVLDFRLAFTPKYFESERLVWKTVIQLNLIRCVHCANPSENFQRLGSSIKKILTVLQEEWDALENDPAGAKTDSPLSSEHRRLALSLSPLLAFETSISQMIASDSSSGGYTVTVRPGGLWKDKLATFGRSSSVTPGPESPTDNKSADPSQVTQVLAGCKDEIIALWEDSAVRRVLDAHGVHLEDDAGLCVVWFYLLTSVLHAYARRTASSTTPRASPPSTTYHWIVR